MSLKERIVKLTGAISASLGGAGIAIAELGLCVCTIGPLISLAGVITIVLSFLADNKIYFIGVGILLIMAGIFISRKNRICKIHKKKK